MRLHLDLRFEQRVASAGKDAAGGAAPFAAVGPHVHDLPGLKTARGKVPEAGDQIRIGHPADGDQHKLETMKQAIPGTHIAPWGILGRGSYKHR